MTDADDIRAYCQKHNIGVLQAKEIFKRNELRDRIKQAETVQDIKDILLEVFPEPERW